MRPITPTKTHKKLYKKGKRWLTALIAGTLIAGAPISLITVMPSTPVIASTIASGVDYSAPWSLSSDGTLTIGAGTLASRNSATPDNPTNPWQSYASQIKAINITGQVTPNPYVKYLFAGLPNLTKVTGLSNIDFSGVSDASGLFYKDIGLTTLSFNGKFQNNTQLTNLFGQMTSLKTLDLTGMSTGNSPVANQLQDALKGDTALTQIKFGGQVYTNASSPVTLPTGGTWFDANKQTHTSYSHTQGTAGQTYIRSTQTVNYVDQNGKRIMTDGIYPGDTTYTEKTPWNTTALNGYIFTIQNADPMTAFTPATIDIANQQDITVHITKVGGTGTIGTVPYYYTNSGDKSALHLGNGQLPAGTTPAVSPFYDITQNTDARTFSQINLDGAVKAPANANSLFAQLVDLTTINGLDHLDTSTTTNMSSMFQMDFMLKSGLENITNWDTSHVTDMSQLFFGINLSVDPSQATTSLDLSGWNTKSVTSFSNMFLNSQFKQITFGPNFKTAQAGSAGVTFPNSSTDGWLHVPTLATDKKQTAYTDDLPSGLYVQGTPASANVTYQAPGGQAIFTDKVWGAVGNDVPYQAIDPWSTDNLTDKLFVYEDAQGNYQSAIPDVPDITLTADNTDDQTLQVLPVKAKGIIGTGENEVRWYLDTANQLHLLGGTLSNATGATTNLWAAAKTTDGQKVSDLTTKILVDAPTDLGANAANMFADFPQLTNISGLDKVTTTATTDMSGMFKNDPKLTSLDLSALNTQNVTTMKDMFAGNTALKTLTQPANGLVGSSVTTISGMFHNASALSALDVATWDTHNVTDMTDAFNGASALKTLAVTNWNTDKLATFDGAFAHMTSLTSLSLGAADSTTNWNTASFDPGSHSLSNLFAGDTALTSVTFSKAFSTAPGITTVLPETAKQLWLRTQDGVALPKDQYTGTATSAGTYTRTTATYTVTLVDDKTNKPLQTFTSDPISSAQIGQPVDVDSLLTDVPGFVAVDNTGPTTATQFTMANGVGTQAITVRVRQVGGPDQFPHAGRDTRLLLLAAGTTIALAGLVGMLFITNKHKKKS